MYLKARVTDHLLKNLEVSNGIKLLRFLCKVEVVMKCNGHPCETLHICETVTNCA